MNPPRIFLSHTNKNKIDRDYTVALAVEFRRVGIDVWLDWEHPLPEATDEHKAAGPTPANPLFQHIVSALCESDAVIYVISQTSFSREYVRLEYDPRVVYEEYRKVHPNILPENLPFYLVLIEPLTNSHFLWSTLISNICTGRCLNMINDGSTPLLIPAVLTNVIRDVAPEYMLPLDPIFEFAARTRLEEDATEAPGCPKDLLPKKWRRLEGLFGLGPLFPEKLSSLSEDELWYGGVRTYQSIKLLESFMIPTFSAPIQNQLRLYWANILLRSRINRYFDGKDLAVETILPSILTKVIGKEDLEGQMAISLAFSYGLLTSTKHPNLHAAASLLIKCRDMFSKIGALPLFALSDVLFSRLFNDTPSTEAKCIIEDFGFDCLDPELHHLYHGVLDASFPGPRMEATTDYRKFVRTFLNMLHDSSSAIIGYGKVGDGEPPSEFFDKLPVN